MNPLPSKASIAFLYWVAGSIRRGLWNLKPFKVRSVSLGWTSIRNTAGWRLLNCSTSWVTRWRISSRMLIGSPDTWTVNVCSGVPRLAVVSSRIKSSESMGGLLVVYLVLVEHMCWLYGFLKRSQVFFNIHLIDCSHWRAGTLKKSLLTSSGLIEVPGQCSPPIILFAGHKRCVNGQTIGNPRIPLFQTLCQFVFLGHKAELA